MDALMDALGPMGQDPLVLALLVLAIGMVLIVIASVRLGWHRASGSGGYVYSDVSTGGGCDGYGDDSYGGGDDSGGSSDGDCGGGGDSD